MDVCGLSRVYKKPNITEVFVLAIYIVSIRYALGPLINFTEYPFSNKVNKIVPGFSLKKKSRFVRLYLSSDYQRAGAYKLIHTSRRTKRYVIKSEAKY